MGADEEAKSPKPEDGALVVLKDGKDDLDVPDDEDNGSQVVDQMAVSGSKKVHHEEDLFGLKEDGEKKSPVSLLKPGFIDLARLTAGVCFGL
jgi:hypothetical protein